MAVLGVRDIRRKDRHKKFLEKKMDLVYRPLHSFIASLMKSHPKAFKPSQLGLNHIRVDTDLAGSIKEIFSEYPQFVDNAEISSQWDAISHKAFTGRSDTYGVYFENDAAFCGWCNTVEKGYEMLKTQLKELENWKIYGWRDVIEKGRETLSKTIGRIC